MKNFNLVQFISASVDHAHLMAAFSSTSMMRSDLTPATDN